MLIVGAKGLGSEVLGILIQNKNQSIALYDDVNKYHESRIMGVEILTNLQEAQRYFRANNFDFCIGVGGPHNRKILAEKFQNIGGELKSVYSQNVDIGPVNNNISDGTILCSGVIITSNVTIGLASLLNLKVTVSHDCKIGDFVELAPGVNVAGNCIIEDGVFVGTNATIIPKIRVGQNSIIAAGSVVTKDVPPNVMVAGVPAVIKKEINIGK